MHPITVLEIITALIPVLILIGILIFSPKFRKKSVYVLFLILCIGELSFFIVRPIWINHQVEVKTELLNQYLSNKYENENWEIQRQEGRQYSPYQLNVIFENEMNIAYLYSVEEKDKIKQVGWAVKEDKNNPTNVILPEDGKHYEENHED